MLSYYWHIIHLYIEVEYEYISSEACSNIADTQLEVCASIDVAITIPFCCIVLWIIINMIMLAYYPPFS